MLAVLITPFLLALLFSLILEPPIALLTRLYGSRKLAALLVFLSFLTLLLLAAGLGFSHLFAELQKLLLHLTDWELATDWWRDGLAGYLADYGLEMAAGLAHLLQATPSAMVSLFVTVFATYYLCAEPDLPLRALILLAPENWRGRLEQVYRRALTAFSTYIRAQAMVMLTSTLWAMLGLHLLGVDYVLLLGLLIGFCDLLPVLGPGTILLPWALWQWAQGDSRLAGGLLLIYLVILVSRQFVEPKIMAAGLGLHPLAALAAGFLGLTLLGAFGLLLGPLLASLLYFVYKESGDTDKETSFS